MSHCEQWQERIALAAGGDLALEEQAAVERHTAACEACRGMLGSVREGLAILREAHAEPIEAGHLPAMRARVMAEVGARRRRGWLWAAVLAGAAAAAAMIWTRPVVAPQLQHVATVRQPAPTVTAEDCGADPLDCAGRARPAGARKASKSRSRGAGSRPGSLSYDRPAAQAQQVVVKLITDDPNVVIYWIAGSN
jgi:hypothetical protein